MPRKSRLKVAADYNWCCWWCNCKLRKSMGWQDSATIEHVIPKSQGGTDALWNLVAACHRCNSQRGSMNSDDFQQIARHYQPDLRSVDVVQQESRQLANRSKRIRRAKTRAIAKRLARQPKQQAKRTRRRARKHTAVNISLSPIVYLLVWCQRFFLNFLAFFRGVICKVTR